MPFATLPKDQNGFPIQALAPAPTRNINGTIGAASARVALPASSDVVRLCATADCYIRFGDSAVNAANSDAIFVKGAEILKIPTGATHLAFLQVSTGGSISVTACE